MNIIYQALFGLDLSPAAKKLLSYYIMNCFSYNNIGLKSDNDKLKSDLLQYQVSNDIVMPLNPTLSIRRLMEELNLSNKTIIKARRDLGSYISDNCLRIPIYYIAMGYVKLYNDSTIEQYPAIQITYSYLKSLTGTKATFYDSRINLCKKVGVKLSNLNNQLAKLKKLGYIQVNEKNGNLIISTQ